MAIILLRLEGPLQSWGERSKWDYRDSSSFPTKSGVIGMISSALGLNRGDPRIINLVKQLEMAARADRIGKQIIDFNTIQSDRILTADHKKRGGNTIISRKCYIQDASFLVALKGPEGLLEEIKAGFEDPRWALYLGRKSCVPSVPIICKFDTIHDDLVSALRAWPLISRHDDRILIEVESTDGTGQMKLDVPVGNRSFESRRVCRDVMDREEDNVSE